MELLQYSDGDRIMRTLPAIGIIILLSFWTVARLTGGLFLPLERWDEQTNVGVVKEMIDRTSLFVPYYQGEPFFEKPPLWYTVQTIVHWRQNVTAVSIRVLNLISAILALFLTVFLAWKRAGLTGGSITWIVMLLSNQLFERNAGGVFSTHTLVSADVDSLLLLFMVISFAASSSKHAWAPVICGVSTGLAVLTKGPIGFVPILAATLLGRVMLKTWIIAFCLILPWHIFMITTFKQAFVQNQYLYHQIYRTFSEIEGHAGPAWFYLQLLTNPRIYPSFPLALLSFVYFVKIRPTAFVLRYAGLTSFLFLLIPSLMGTKLAWYILPLYPFLALFTGLMVGLPNPNNNK